MALERENRSLQAHIKQALRDEIGAGVWPQGAQLPTEPELMRRFGVSRITVSQALRDLANDGLVVRRQGKGTFVSSHPQGWTNLGALLQRMPLHLGRNLDHSLNYLSCTVPPAAIALDLQLTPSEETWTFTRVKLVGSARGQWEEGHIPASLVQVEPAAILARSDWGQFYFVEILRDLTGQTARQCRAFLQAVVLSPEIAETMGEVPGKPTLEVTRLWRNELNQPVLLTRSIFRPDGTRYYVDLPELPAERQG